MNRLLAASISAVAAAVVGFSIHVASQGWPEPAGTRGHSVLGRQVPRIADVLRNRIGRVIAYALVRPALPGKSSLVRGLLLGDRTRDPHRLRQRRGHIASRLSRRNLRCAGSAACGRRSRAGRRRRALGAEHGVHGACIRRSDREHFSHAMHAALGFVETERGVLQEGTPVSQRSEQVIRGACRGIAPKGAGERTPAARHCLPLTETLVSVQLKEAREAEVRPACP